MARKPKPCIECGRRPKDLPRQRCATCHLRHQPIGDQVTAARLRLAMVPEDMRKKRTPTIQRMAPEGTAFCSGCQSFRDLEDFLKGATKCRPCASAGQHEAMIQRTYGIDGDEYERLLRLQGGKCAICRNRPRTQRLAVDHNHSTGAVRGLLCVTCNHEHLGGAWDSIKKVEAAWHYLNTPPTSGSWVAPEKAPALAPAESAAGPRAAQRANVDIASPSGKKHAAGADEAVECTLTHYLPIGSGAVDGKRGLYFVEDTPGSDAPF